MTSTQNQKEVFISDLIKAQESIESIVKSTSNAFFKSKYADLAEILKAVKPALNKHKLFLCYKDSQENGIDYIAAQIHHINGEFIECKMPIKIKNEADRNDPQKYGAAVTYARRYSISALLALAEEDDDGNSAADKKSNIMPEVYDALIQMISNADDNKKLTMVAMEIKKMKERYYFDEIQIKKLDECYLERKKLNNSDKPAF